MALHGKSFLRWIILGYEWTFVRIIDNQMLKSNMFGGNFHERKVEMLMADISSQFLYFLYKWILSDESTELIFI